jgi:hypothetical protein
MVETSIFTNVLKKQGFSLCKRHNFDRAEVHVTDSKPSQMLQ